MLEFPITRSARANLNTGGDGRSVSGKDCDLKTFINLMKDEAGASAAEYALILAIVGAAIAFAAVSLGGSIKNAMDDAKTCIDNPPTSSTTC